MFDRCLKVAWPMNTGFVLAGQRSLRPPSSRVITLEMVARIICLTLVLLTARAAWTALVD